MNCIQKIILDQSKNYKDNEISEKLCLSRQHLNRIKNGKSFPSAVTLARICIMFGLNHWQIQDLLMDIILENQKGNL